jgi:hypothetical protein
MGTLRLVSRSPKRDLTNSETGTREAQRYDFAPANLQNESGGYSSQHMCRIAKSFGCDICSRKASALNPGSPEYTKAERIPTNACSGTSRPFRRPPGGAAFE